MSSKLQSTDSKTKDQQPSHQESLSPPKANAEAIDFLESLQLKEIQLLLFSETLAMVSDTGEPLGELTIDVQKGSYSDKLGIFSECLLVHAYSRGFLNKLLCGNSVLGYISGKMEIMEQKSQEYIKFLVLPMERKTNLVRQEDQLTMTRVVKEGEVSIKASLRSQTQIYPMQEVKTEVTFFPWNSIAGFISEAANLVILRVMAWRQMVPSNARFLALDTEGKLCYSTYQALGFQTFQVGRQQAKVFIVEQTVHSEENIPMSCQFYLFSDGHLAKRVQVGSPGCCIVTKMPILREEDEIEPPPVFEAKPLPWEEDLELYSKFLDRKEELRLSHASYMRHHPQAQALISDFLLFLLLRQPADVVTFAAEHFGPFSVHSQPTSALRSSNRPSPFRSLVPKLSFRKESPPSPDEA